MSGWCAACYGGILYGRAVYCEVGRDTVCYGGVMCGRVVYALPRCTPPDHTVTTRPHSTLP